ncbi:MAG: hypothetical protein QW231_00945 [Candidatus Bathyarchaeia archaeon]
MELIKGSVKKEIEEIFRRRAMEKYGYSKGAVSKALEAAIRLWLRYEYELKEEEKLNNDAFEEIVGEVEAKFSGMYAVIAEGRLIGVYKSLEEAMKTSVKEGSPHRVIFKIGETPKPKVRLGWRAKLKPAGAI